MIKKRIRWRDMFKNCDCHRCERRRDKLRDKLAAVPILVPGMTARFMVLCPECGNKRCPKASDHRRTCTKSNDPGQDGSIYQ